MQLSTEHYAFARGDGTRLYPSATGLTALIRTVALCREHGGFVTLQDRVLLDTPRRVEQLFHSMTPSATHNSDAPWVKLTNLNGTVPGLRVLAPAAYTATVTTQESNKYLENMDDDGKYGCVRVRPTSSQSNVVFLELLWPTRSTEWTSRPAVQPLDPAKPHRGFVLPLSAMTESWIYNTTGAATSAGDLRIEGGSADGIAVKRANADGSLSRLVVCDALRLLDSNGTQVLLDLVGLSGAIEVAFTGTRADLSGMTKPVGVKFYGPTVTDVRYRGTSVTWTMSNSTVTVTAVS
jgi:hypothetical protein